MCTVLLPPCVNPIAVNIYNVSYRLNENVFKHNYKLYCDTILLYNTLHIS